MIARYQNPKTGLFISKDPWGGNKYDPQTFNKYSYSRNNPINYYDPTGTEVQAVGRDLKATEKGSHSYLLITPEQADVFIEMGYMSEGDTSFTLGGYDVDDKLVGKHNHQDDYKDLNDSRVQDYATVDNPYGYVEDPEADTQFIKEIIKTHENAPDQDYNMASFNLNGRNCHNYTTSLIEGGGGEVPGDFKPTGLHPGLGESIPSMVNNDSGQSSQTTSQPSSSMNNKSLTGLWNKFINYFKSE